MIRTLSWLAILRRQLAVKIAWRVRRETPRTGPLGLKKRLVAEGRTRWLDIGNGDKFDPGFHYLDWFPHEPPTDVPAERCFQGDILRLTGDEFKKMGQFDLVRMQHVLEHFCFEDGPALLGACAKLLKQDGVLLLTVPDLRFFVNAYLCDGFGAVKNFQAFASARVPVDAPPGAYFSVFAHSFAHSPQNAQDDRAHRDQHKWCYDAEGVIDRLRQSGCFTAIEVIGLLHPLACIPFTHNKPEQDLCVMARLESE